MEWNTPTMIYWKQMLTMPYAAFSFYPLYWRWTSQHQKLYCFTQNNVLLLLVLLLHRAISSKLQLHRSMNELRISTNIVIVPPKQTIKHSEKTRKTNIPRPHAYSYSSCNHKYYKTRNRYNTILQSMDSVYTSCALFFFLGCALLHIFIISIAVFSRYQI